MNDDAKTKKMFLHKKEIGINFSRKKSNSGFLLCPARLAARKKAIKTQVGWQNQQILERMKKPFSLVLGFRRKKKQEVD